MKKIIVASLALSLILPVGVDRAFALSCLPIDMYLEEVVGDEEIVIFEATSVDRIEEKEHTIEVLKVTEAKQGWVEEDLFVYHEKHPDWGYLCNSGPKAEGSKGIYVAARNNQNQYSVYQRLDLTDPLVAGLESDLQAEEIEGGVSEITPNDRMNQIMTSIQDLFMQIATLVKEYSYWKNN
jgi:hypothetical protein